ncbi:MAG: zinc-binding dehydrogenase [Gemmatimonadaceae bacterium]|nr:zinc-binding dehydrogenase [Gemmatimonadaceae bacterium]
MRALTISTHGGLDSLEYRTDLPVPEPGPGQLRVRVRAAALNHLDVWMLGGLPGVTIRPPWTLGADACGVVDKLGTDTAGAPAKVGDYVVINPGISCRRCEFCLRGEHSACVKFGLLGEHFPGTLAEYVIVPATNVRAIPADTKPEIAAAFTLATITAWRMIVSRAQVQAGETVLIWGIGGGVAIAALQIAKLRGATVFVTSSSDAKLARARELGADATFNHAAVDVVAEVRALTGKRGVDVVVDDVGPATWERSLGSLAKLGRLVTCGATSGPKVETDVRKLFWNQWTILGSTMGSDAEFDAIVRELAQGRLLPPVDSVFDLENGRAAFERLQAGGQFGKVVVRISNE